MKNLKYIYPIEHLFTGSSLGNRFAFAQLDEATNVIGLWSSTDNQFYLGEWKISIVVNDEMLIPTETIFRPHSQTSLLKRGDVGAEMEFLLPFAVDDCREYDDSLRAGILLLRLKNDGRDKARFVVKHSIVFPASPSDKFTKKPPDDQTKKLVSISNAGRAYEVTTHGNVQEARIFWADQTAHRSTSDDRSLQVEYEFGLVPNQNLEKAFVFAFSPDGMQQTYNTLQQCKSTETVIEWTLEQFDELLSRTEVVTPEPVINRGLQWAKVNTARVQHQFRIGEGFTNDPPQDIVVIRDLAWYLLGSDYMTPTFSRGLLKLAEDFAFHDDGKLTEFIRANEGTPEKHDYKLNINDDTPLYVYGLYHYAVTCGDESFLRTAYPLMKRAGDYILSQIKDGLVRCYADGTHVWGICSWRNIIDDYNLTGAVTEINAECYYALRLIATVASKIGNDAETNFYTASAEDLKRAINTTLVSEKTNLYLLNLDNKNERHHDVTGDLIFPVMFGVAGDAMRERILDRLSSEEFWTQYGTRTVSPNEANYDPDFGYQLVGGVWHNLTAWTAYCLRRRNPEKLVEGLLNTYRLSEIEKPIDFVNVVPGEFPERLHGETFESRGMAMSPWMPPTYLWLVVEGLLGVQPTLDGLEANPAIPSSWKWIAISHLLYKNERVSALLFEGILYSTHAIHSVHPTRKGKLLSTTSDSPNIFTLGFALRDEAVFFVAANEAVTGRAMIEHERGPIWKDVALKAGEGLLYRFPIESETGHESKRVETSS